MIRELLDFEALVYGHQYLSLSIVSIVPLSHQNALAPALRMLWRGYTTRDGGAGRSYPRLRSERWLGHHPRSFTIDTYIHLLDDDLGEPLAPSQISDQARTSANAGSGSTSRRSLGPRL
jgi:hypothetical protein